MSWWNFYVFQFNWVWIRVNLAFTVFQQDIIVIDSMKLSFIGFSRVLLGFNEVLLGFTEYFKVEDVFNISYFVFVSLKCSNEFLPSFHQLNRIFRGFTGFYWVLLGFTGFYWVLLGSNEIDHSWHCFHKFLMFWLRSYRVLLGFTGFYWVLLGSNKIDDVLTIPDIIFISF